MFELQALRLGLYGLEGVDPKTVRRLARGRYWLETQLMLREYGVTEAEIATLMRTHRQGCPCWYCVLSLNRRVKAHRKQLEARHGKRT